MALLAPIALSSRNLSLSQTRLPGATGSPAAIPIGWGGGAARLQSSVSGPIIELHAGKAGSGKDQVVQSHIEFVLCGDSPRVTDVLRKEGVGYSFSRMTRSCSKSSLMRHFCRVFAPRMTPSELDTPHPFRQVLTGQAAL